MLRIDDIPQQVADDIQGFALMRCNSCGIDDIHGCAVIGMRRNHRKNTNQHKEQPSTVDKTIIEGFLALKVYVNAQLLASRAIGILFIRQKKENFFEKFGFFCKSLLTITPTLAIITS